jgi:hypothetical protein
MVNIMFVLNGKDLKLDQLNSTLIKNLKNEKSSLAERAKQAQTFDDAFNNLVNQFKSVMLPFVEALNTALVTPIANLQTILKDKNVLADLKSLAEKVGTLVGSIGKFIIENPITSLVAALGGTVFFNAAKWYATGMQLGRGFNAVANVGGKGGGVMDGLFGKNRGLSGGVGRLGKAFGGGGMKGVGTAAGRMIKASAKGNLITSSLMGLGDIGMNLYEGKDVGESLVRALLTTGVGFGGGALGTLVAPGAGTVAGSMAGGMLGQQIGDWVYGDKTQEANVQ